MNSISGSTAWNECCAPSMNEAENTASDRMASYRFPPFPVGLSIPASREFEPPKMNPIWAPPPVEIPSCVTWSFLTAPPPEDLPGLAMHAHQMALAVLDVHERLLALEARNRCAEGLISRLRRLWR